jgi:hypothetical protein
MRYYQIADRSAKANKKKAKISNESRGNTYFFQLGFFFPFNLLLKQNVILQQLVLDHTNIWRNASEDDRMNEW